MHEAVQSVFAFPGVELVSTKREKTRLQRLWDYFQEIKEAVAGKGMIVPQHLAAELLGVSHQRVGQFITEGRLEVVDIRGVKYITEVSLVEFCKVERKNGRPPKNLSNSEIWAASKQHSKEVVSKVS